MNNGLKKTGEEILKENLHELPEIKCSVPSYTRIFLSLILSVFFFLTTIFIHYSYIQPIMLVKDHDVHRLFTYKLYFSLSSFLTTLFFLDSIILMITNWYYTLDHQTSVLGIILTDKNLWIKIPLSLFLISIFLSFHEKLIVSEIVEEPKGDEIDTTTISKSMYIIENFSSILFSASIFLLILCLKTMMMDVFKYKSHYSHYKERIDKNDENTHILHILNKATGLRMSDNIYEWAKLVFNKLSPHDPFLTYNSCSYIFGEENAKRILKLFDTNNDNSITQDEFISVYFGVIKEKDNLNKALQQKTSLFSKLNIIITSVVIPCGLFMSVSILGGASYFRNYASIFSGTILSLSFIFSSVAGEVFRSLIFIFLVRPFEAGDILKIDDKIYIVEEIGLLYTSYIVNSLSTYIQNTSLMNKNIINFRLSSVDEKKYNYTFNLKEFRRKREVLVKELQEKVNENTKINTGKFEIMNYKILSRTLINLDIVIYFRINFQYVKGLVYDEDKFALILDDIFEEIELRYE